MSGSLRPFMEMGGIRSLGRASILCLVIALCASGGGPGAGAQEPQEAFPGVSRLTPGEVGTAWFQEDFGGLFAIEDITVTPPPEGLGDQERRLVVKLMGPGDTWKSVLDLPVGPAAPAGSTAWSRVSPTQEPPPELAEAYALIRQAMAAQGRSEPEDPEPGLEAVMHPPEPVLARAIRVELIGPSFPEGAWVFVVRTDPLVFRHGGVSHEWKYTHVW